MNDLSQRYVRRPEGPLNWASRIILIPNLINIYHVLHAFAHLILQTVEEMDNFIILMLQTKKARVRGVN